VDHKLWRLCAVLLEEEQSVPLTSPSIVLIVFADEEGVDPIGASLRFNDGAQQ
jgi:hypothetical protein